MAQITKPLAGGSYIRGKDGNLKQVAGTETSAAVAVAVKAAAPEQISEPSVAPAGAPKKGK